MRIEHFYTTLKTILKTNMDIVVLISLVAFIAIFGGIGVYLAERGNPGANITRLGDALWWAVVTIATVGYGDYYPVTTLGRVIAIFVMLSGIGIFVLLVSSLSQRRMQRVQSRLKSKTNVEPGLLGEETKRDIKNKMDEIEKLTRDVQRLLYAG
jgi:voltage-gated potassium channel